MPFLKEDDYLLGQQNKAVIAAVGAIDGPAQILSNGGTFKDPEHGPTDVKNSTSEELSSVDAPKHHSFSQVCFAYALFITSVTLFCISHVSVQYLGGIIPDNELNSMRFGFGVIVTPFFLIRYRGSKFLARKNWLAFCILSPLTVGYNFTLYAAATYAPVAVVGGLSIATAIVTNALLSICLKSERRLENYIGSILAFSGIILLSQPEFIFPKGEELQNVTAWISPCVHNHTEVVVEDVVGRIEFGYILAVISGLVMSVKMHFMRHILATENSFVVTLWVCICGTAISLIFMLILETPAIMHAPICGLALLAHCFGATQYTIALLYTLERLSVLPTNLIASLELPILLLFQYTLMRDILPGHQNWIEIVGAVLCFLGSVGATAYKLTQQWRQTG